MAVKTMKDGTKLYPVCNWEENQHKIVTAYTKALLRRDEAYESGVGIDEAEANFEQMEQARQWIDNVGRDGIVYAPYPMYQLLRDTIGAYDLTH